MKTLIDGYNLIFAWGWMPTTRSAQAAEQSRARLIQKLEQFIPASIRSQFTLVFDVKSSAKRKSATKTRSPRRDEAILERSGFQVQFAYEYPDADTLIEELIRKEVAPQRLAVVSTDQRLRSATERRGAWSIRSEDFLDCVAEIVEECMSNRTHFAEDYTNEDERNAMSAETDRFAQLSLDQVPDSKQKAIENLQNIDWIAEFGLDLAETDPPILEQTANELPENAKSNKVSAEIDPAGLEREESNTANLDSIREVSLDDLVDTRLKKRTR